MRIMRPMSPVKPQKSSKTPADGAKKENREPFDDISLGMPIGKIQEDFPNLYKEIVGKPKTLKIDQVDLDESTIQKGNNEETSGEQEEIAFEASEEDDIDETIDNSAEEESSQELEEIEGLSHSQKPQSQDALSGFDPKAVDFIRRANTPQEALEVISYLEKRREIKEGEASDLRSKLEKEGLLGFGPRKTAGYYFQFSSTERMKEKMKLTKPSNVAPADDDRNIDNSDEDYESDE